MDTSVLQTLTLKTGFSSFTRYDLAPPTRPARKAPPIRWPRPYMAPPLCPGAWAGRGWPAGRPSRFLPPQASAVPSARPAASLPPPAGRGPVSAGRSWTGSRGNRGKAGRLRASGGGVGRRVWLAAHRGGSVRGSFAPKVCRDQPRSSLPSACVEPRGA